MDVSQTWFENKEHIRIVHEQETKNQIIEEDNVVQLILISLHPLRNKVISLSLIDHQSIKSFSEYISLNINS